MDSLNPVEALKFLAFVNDLKHTSRRGWDNLKVDNHESVSGHMYAMGMMTFLLGNNSTLNRYKCLQLAMVHDLAESIVGDITPHDNIPIATKHQMEDEAMKKITSHLEGDVGKMIYDLYKEYEAKETPEAKFVKDLDRFDLLFTAVQYEKRDKTPKKMEEFFEAYNDQFEHPFVKQLVTALHVYRGKNETFGSKGTEISDGHA